MSDMLLVMFTVKGTVNGTRSIQGKEMLLMSKNMVIDGHWARNSTFFRIGQRGEFKKGWYQMIKYTVNNNAVIAEFRRDWVDTLIEYYTNNTYIDYATIHDVVYDYLLKAENDGLKFYGEAKCSPDDVFDEEIGKQIARTRLINKYNRVVAGINRILLKLVESDMRYLRTSQR